MVEGGGDAGADVIVTGHGRDLLMVRREHHIHSLLAGGRGEIGATAFVCWQRREGGCGGRTVSNGCGSGFRREFTGSIHSINIHTHLRARKFLV